MIFDFVFIDNQSISVIQYFPINDKIKIPLFIYDFIPEKYQYKAKKCKIDEILKVLGNLSKVESWRQEFQVSL